jgi:hypothetical protein
MPLSAPRCRKQGPFSDRSPVHSTSTPPVCCFCVCLPEASGGGDVPLSETTGKMGMESWGIPLPLKVKCITNRTGGDGRGTNGPERMNAVTGALAAGRVAVVSVRYYIQPIAFKRKFSLGYPRRRQHGTSGTYISGLDQLLFLAKVTRLTLGLSPSLVRSHLPTVVRYPVA